MSMFFFCHGMSKDEIMSSALAFSKIRGAVLESDFEEDLDRYISLVENIVVVEGWLDEICVYSDRIVDDDFISDNVEIEPPQ